MLMYRSFDTFGMDGAPADMRRFNPDAMNFKACLKGACRGDNAKTVTRRFDRRDSQLTIGVKRLHVWSKRSAARIDCIAARPAG